MKIDDSKFWLRAGQLIGPMLYENAIDARFLKEICETLKRDNRAHLLLAEVLKDVISTKASIICQI